MLPTPPIGDFASAANNLNDNIVDNLNVNLTDPFIDNLNVSLTDNLTEGVSNVF